MFTLVDIKTKENEEHKSLEQTLSCSNKCGTLRIRIVGSLSAMGKNEEKE